jgi:hypothetical protein
MAHGVSPGSDGKLWNDKEDKEEEVFEDAMETTHTSETAATAAAEEKTTSANAEMPGPAAEEAKQDEG